VVRPIVVLVFLAGFGISSWNYKLDPGVKNGPFTEAEVELFRSLVGKYGQSWTEIAKHMPGRYAQRWYSPSKPTFVRVRIGLRVRRCANDLRNRYYSAKRTAKRTRLSKGRKSDDARKRQNRGDADTDVDSREQIAAGSTEQSTEFSACDLETLARFAECDPGMSAGATDRLVPAAVQSASVRYDAYEALVVKPTSGIRMACCASAAEIAESDRHQFASSHGSTLPTIAVPHSSVVVSQSNRIDAKATPTKPLVPQGTANSLPAWFLSTVSPLLTGAVPHICACRIHSCVFSAFITVLQLGRLHKTPCSVSEMLQHTCHILTHAPTRRSRVAVVQSVLHVILHPVKSVIAVVFHAEGFLCDYF
jgi:hypothetical protein